MLTLQIKPVCRTSGIFKPYAWLRKHGFSHHTAHNITSGKYRHPTLDLVERLCLLLGCTPNDILQWTPPGQYDRSTPLASLIPDSENLFDWSEDLEQLTPEQLRNLGDQIKELRKG